MRSLSNKIYMLSFGLLFSLLISAPALAGKLGFNGYGAVFLVENATSDSIQASDTSLTPHSKVVNVKVKKYKVGPGDKQDHDAVVNIKDVAGNMICKVTISTKANNKIKVGVFKTTTDLSWSGKATVNQNQHTYDCNLRYYKGKYDGEEVLIANVRVVRGGDLNPLTPDPK